MKNVILGFILCPCLDNSVILLCGAPCGLTCSHLLWGEIGWIENTWSKWDGGNPREPERERLTAREGAVEVGRLIGLVVWNSHQHCTPLYISCTMLAHFTYWVLQTKARQRIKTHRPVLGEFYRCCCLRCTLLTWVCFRGSFRFPNTVDVLILLVSLVLPWHDAEDVSRGVMSWSKHGQPAYKHTWLRHTNADSKTWLIWNPCLLCITIQKLSKQPWHLIYSSVWSQGR